MVFAWVVAAMLLCAAPAPALVLPVCAVTNFTALTFGTLYQTDQPQDGRASFVINCTRAQTVTISLLYSHRLKSPSAGDLTYDLYADPNHAVLWGSGADGAGVAETVPAGRPVTIFIYARIPGGQRPVAGDFSDSIAIEMQAF